ncbi:hypothetical protein F4Z98_06055 [Candidatus Poribacteria bacterium]|nr:hypothetical protein [Candidatus Poribacteria bacterium]MYB01757.1 hypothetical protein [Candidatus Poribacteria bacterium]
MLANIFSNRYFIGALAFFLFCVGGSLFYSYHQTQKDAEDAAETEARIAQWHAKQDAGETEDGTPLPAGLHETGKLPLVDASDKHNPVTAPQQIGYPPLPPSSVPDDIPEHLKLPDEWKVPYYDNFSEGVHPIPQEEGKRFISIFREIVRDYNPQRPIGNIWHQYIEYEKMYRAYAEQDLNRTPFAEFSSGRAEWQYEQAWAFPEIIDIIIGDSSEDEKNLFLDARLVAMGELEANWNEHILHDGRAFYLRYDTRYEFKWTTPEGVERKTGFSRAGNPKATVVIYPDETSDEELERLGWWNFHINPYTLQPVNYQPYNMRN